jgi:hypothetical protein
MLLQPTPFAAALADRSLRDLLPTTLSSADLATLPAEIRSRSLFSARVPYARHLSTLDRLIGQILDPSASSGPGDYMNEALARKLLRESLDDLGYAPDPAEAGGLKDLRSESRIRLQVKMGVDMARSHGQWTLTQDPDVLNEFPAWRFLPSLAAKPRGDSFWRARWSQAGLPQPQGKLVALKTDPGWRALSAFGLPYPPFDYGSTRDVEEVDRAEAEALGLIASDTRLQGQRTAFDEGLQAQLPEPSPPLLEAILRAMPGARFVDGVLTALGSVA